MLFAAGFARLRTVGFQRLGTAALMVLIVGLSTLRLGYVYEWTLRTRVADTVVDDLARLCPTPSAGDLVVVDGVQQYGQCFLYSFGFSHEFSADRGVAVDVTTELRSDAGMLLANLDWYDWRPVDLATTHFFQWDETTGHLEPSSFDAYRRRHPDMTVTHEPERKL
jgi:hypothetical protein